MKPNSKLHRTILCVDDDADDQLLVYDAIKAIDKEAHVATAMNGFEALQYLELAQPQEYPCLIILDINMPLLDGKQTLARIKGDARFAEVPIVMFTTSSSQLDRTFCEQYGIPFVTKPLKYTDLHNIVADILLLCKVSAN